jgi:hypothetical protein
LQSEPIVDFKDEYQAELYFQYLFYFWNGIIFKRTMIAEKVAKNLRLENAKKILVINAPKEYTEFIGNMTYDTDFQSENEKSYDFVQVFAKAQSELENLVVQVKDAGKYDCVFWACYPKGGGSIKSDIKRDTVWKAFDLIGLEAVSQVAIDETWSALRARPKEMVGK